MHPAARGASGAETADYFSGPSVELSVIGAEKLGGELKFRSTEIAPKNDRDISILEMLPEICAEQDVSCKEVVLTTLRANGVHMHPGRRVEGIESDGVRAYDMAAKQEIFLPADTVILAGGLRSNAEDAFQDTAYPVIRVGDAQDPRRDLYGLLRRERAVIRRSVCPGPTAEAARSL